MTDSPKPKGDASKGGQAIVKKYGSAWMRAIGSRGGKKHSSEHMSKISKAGYAKRLANKKETP